MKHSWRVLLFPILLVLITVAISFINYTPGTWLTGWDTLHPEFDFWLNFKRIIFGVWRADQGLGAVAAHAHMSELPRLLILWFFSIFFHDSLLRYLYVFLCFILGPLGIYVFLKKTILAEKTLAGSIAAFLGALFYIFNLGTVQHFFVPFEMFITQYASLGWLFYFATEYMIHIKRKSLGLFALVSFFASSMAYASILWYAYAFGFTFYLLTICVIVKRKHLIKSAAVLLVTLFLTNAYWLLPNWYFLKSHAFEVPNAATNILFSEEAFLHNKQYGNLKDAITVKSFLFNWNEQEGENLIFQHKMLEEWNKHLASPFIGSIGYIVFLLVLAGVIIAFFDFTTSRQTLKMAMFPLGLFALLMIINMNPPFSYIFDSLREQFSTFREGLRFPWTKFSMLLMFAMSVYFALFWQWFFKKAGLKIPAVITISILFIVYSWPMFQGHLIDKQLRIEIPREYFALFEWINNQPDNGRVAPLPMHSPWGWEYYDWGYQGSGFLWFGINKPVLARDFDRWNPNNEQYYRQMGTALYARDVKRVEALAEAYQIGYFILDENVIFPENKPNALWFSETKDIFSRSKRFHLAKTFEKISVYKFDLDRNSGLYIKTPPVIISVGPKLTGGYQDQAVSDYTSYIYDNNPTVIYPFRDLIDRYGHLDPQSFSIIGKIGYINLGKMPSGTLSGNWTNRNIYPSVALPYELVAEEKSQILNNGGNLLVSFPVTGKTVYLKDNRQTIGSCGSEKNEGGRKIIDDFVSLTAISSTSCDFFTFPASQDIGYLLIIESRNVEGLPNRLCISSHITRRCDTYAQLTTNKQWTKEIFVIPPYPTGPSDLSGFDVNFNTISIGNIRSSNDVRSAQLIAFPYHRLENLSFIDTNRLNNAANSLRVSNDRENNIFSYTATLDTNGNSKVQGLFVLNQAYENGWLAYRTDRQFPYIHTVGKHVEYNNWANAWLLNDLSAMEFPETTHIVFVPQLLQYIGLLLLPIVFVLIFRRFTPVQ